jgi:hypothetical protein
MVYEGAVTADELAAAPIAQVLLSLREALMNSAKKSSTKVAGVQACFADYNPEKPGADAGNTFQLGLVFAKDTKGGLEIKVGIVDLTATTEWKSTSGNTLTIAFVQRRVTELQLRDAIDTECMYPKTPKDEKCAAALLAYHKVQETKGKGLRRRRDGADTCLPTL